MKNNKMKLVVLINLIIFLGLLAIGIVSYIESSRIIKDDMYNITELTTMNISSKINNDLIKPIIVSLTMANDQFLKDWIEENERSILRITEYLNVIKDKYDYDSTFLISDRTKNYYHYNGMLKKISETDAHDVWYYDFLNMNTDYDLLIDTDQAAKDSLTFFVNSRITDDNGNVLGVAGTGLELKRFNQILNEYKHDLGIDVFLVNRYGNIQMHPDEHYFKNYNIFEEENIASIQQQILQEKKNMSIFEVSINNTDKYLVTQYIEELDWYLVVMKDMTILKQMLQRQLITEGIITVVAFVIIIFINRKLINHYQSRVDRMAAVDMLTDLSNRRMFDEYLKESMNIANHKEEPLLLVIFDIDDFKAINDTCGHAEGDEVIKAVANTTSRFIRDKDMLARWGGDEFAIIFHCRLESVNQVVNRIQAGYQEHKLLKKHRVSVSFGVAEYIKGESSCSLLARADRAMYAEKNKHKEDR